MARVKKAWFVEALRTTVVKGVGGVELQTTEKVTSRPYHIQSAATDYAAALEKSGTCDAGTVVVRTKFGNDKIEGDIWPLAI